MIWPEANVASMSWAALANRSAVSRSWAKPAWRAASMSRSGEVVPPASTRQIATFSTSARRRLSRDSMASASWRWTWRARASGVRSRTTSPWTGWARVASKRRPSSAVSTRPLRSSRTRASEPTRPGEHVDAQRLAEGDQLEGGHLVVVQAGQALADQVLQALGGQMEPNVRHMPASSTSVPASTPARTSSRRYWRLPSLASQSCWRAAPSTGRRRPARAGPRSRTVQRPDVDPLAEAVLPDGLDRVGGGLARAHAGDGEDGPGRHQLLEQQGGRVVQPLGVVDQQQEALAATALHERLGGLAEHGDAPLDGESGRREDRGEGAERDAPGGLAGGGPFDVEAGGGAELGDLGRKAGLAHAGRTGEDDPRQIASTEVLARLFEDLGTPHEGPRGAIGGGGLWPGAAAAKPEG